jgi:hypothetical protein
LEDFLADYEASRLFGFGMAIMACSMIYNENMVPEHDQPLSEEKFEAIMLTDQSIHTERLFDTNPKFKEAITEIIEELIPYLDAWKHV